MSKVHILQYRRPDSNWTIVNVFAKQLAATFEMGKLIGAEIGQDSVLSIPTVTVNDDFTFATVANSNGILMVHYRIDECEVI